MFAAGGRWLPDNDTVEEFLPFCLQGSLPDRDFLGSEQRFLPCLQLLSGSRKVAGLEVEPTVTVLHHQGAAHA